MTDLTQQTKALTGTPLSIPNIPVGEINSGKYTVRFAQTEEELDSILKMRFEIFNIELGEGLESSFDTGKDEDEFDAQCHHLMVIHTGDDGIDKLVGTYRMQTSEMAQAANGFYSGSEYKLDEIPEDMMKESLEVGRACIAKEHRNSRVLFLLWRGLGRYIVHTNKRYFFGCCSLTSQDANEGWRVMNYLEKNGMTRDDFKVNPHEGYVCYDENFQADEPDKKVDVPRLFKTYLNFGGKICSRPAIDRTFKTIDYLLILDISELDKKTFDMFTQ